MRSVVWLKRDLRLNDHRPLAAAADGECLLLYVAEPSWRSAEDFDGCHEVFIRQSLLDLRPRLESLGGRLVYAEGEAVDVLDRLRMQWAFDRLLSHEETGNAVSYRRDRDVRAWADRSGVAWEEFPQHGVFRGLAERDGWAARWRRRMDEPVTDEPARLRSPDCSFDVEHSIAPRY